MKRIISLVLAALMLLALLGGCSKDEPAPETAEPAVDENAPATENNDPLVTIELESGDKVYVELYPDVAPNTVNNFISLIEQGFYDGVIFHRVIDGLIIQGGDPEGTGYGGPDYSIAGEMTNNGFENTLSHTRGVISMARALSYDSAGSQFFIMCGDYPAWDGEYCAFGKVIQGMEFVDEIAAAEVENANTGRPVEPVAMKTVTVNTFGVDYPEPETIG